MVRTWLKSVLRNAVGIWGAVVLLVGLTSLGGCGGGKGEPPRFQVSGNITYGGQPVPAGSILFEPDGAKGNSGPAGFAQIQDGKYDTALDGEGVVGGPHVVRITALDGVANPCSSGGVILCPDYSVALDLPKEKATQDFDIPKSKPHPSESVHGP